MTALDGDAPSVAEARSHGDDIDHVIGDLLTVGLRDASSDVVTAVAMLHHVDQRAGLAQLARLLRPGGVLLVVGLARSRWLRDVSRDAVDSVAVRRHTMTKTVWQNPAPKVWPPPLTCRETRDLSLDVLPGARLRRQPYFRYGLTWARA